MASTRDLDWLFDMLTALFQSPSWEAPVQTFIDENCVVFDSEEENPHSHLEAYTAFKELVEMLLAAALTDVGISEEAFMQAMEASRFANGINRAVYEQLRALDDFLVFKKLMVKRNMELELEAVRALRRKGWLLGRAMGLNLKSDSKSEDTADMDSKESFSGDEGDGDGDGDAGYDGAAEDGDMWEAMQADMMELDLLHRREEIERRELEQAIELSLALASDAGGGYGGSINGSNDGPASQDSFGLRQAQPWRSGDSTKSHRGSSEGKEDSQGAKTGSKDCFEGEEPPAAKGNYEPSQLRETPLGGGIAEAKAGPDTSRDKHAAFGNAVGGSSGGGQSARSTAAWRPGGSAAVAGAGTGTAKLPPLDELERARKSAEAAARQRQQEQMDERRRQLAALGTEVKVQEDRSGSNGGSPEVEDAEARARHLREMRDHIVAKKRAEREKEARRAQVLAGDADAEAKSGGAPADRPGGSAGGGDAGNSVVTEAERRRQQMREALGRRMKRELAAGEAARAARATADRMAQLDDKLKAVQQLQDENRAKEEELAQRAREQQAQRARNASRAAATAVGGRGGDGGGGSRDEFAFNEG